MTVADHRATVRATLGHAHLAQLERALDARDVPYRVESRSLVWATDAVRELLSVLAAIEDPADDIDDVALAELQRSLADVFQ